MNNILVKVTESHGRFSVIDLIDQAEERLRCLVPSTQGPSLPSSGHFIASIPTQGRGRISVHMPWTFASEVRSASTLEDAETTFITKIARASEIAKVILDTVEIFWGGKLPFIGGRKALEMAGMLYYLPLVFSGRWIEFLKYTVTYKFVESEFPMDHPSKEFPEPKSFPCKEKLWLFPGLFGYLLNAKLKEKRGSGSESLRTISWRWTLLNGLKKGLPHADKEFILKTAEKHAETLSIKRESDPAFMIYLDRFMKNFVGKFGGPLRYEAWANDEIHDISVNSCYEQTRAGNGNFGVLRMFLCNSRASIDDSIRRHLGVEEKVDSSGLDRSGLLLMREEGLFPWFGDFKMAVSLAAPPTWWEGTRCSPSIGTDLMWDHVDHSYLCPTLLLKMEHFPGSGLVSESRIPAFMDHFHDEVSYLRDFSVKEDIPGYCFAKFILEPLKVRTITAGSIVTNGIYKPLQAQLWSRLQKFKQFRLTGSEMSLEILQDLASCYGGLSQKSEKPLWVAGDQWKYWCSGDFSGATDNLNADVTELILKHISGDPYTFSVLSRGLLRNRIGYSTEEERMGAHVGSVLQTNGQLMGCVFSFPILCIANMATYCYTLDSSPSCRIPSASGGISDFFGRDFDRLPVLINGDDILFKTDLTTYRRWEKVVASVGLFKSLGKNYLKEDLAIINSTMYKLRGGNWVHIPYVNMGWATGVRKGEEAAVGRLHTRAQTEKLEEVGLGLQPLVSFTSSVQEQEDLIHQSEWTREKPFWNGVLNRFKEVAFRRRRESAVETHLHFGNSGPWSFGAIDDGRPSKERAFSHWLSYNMTKRARPCSSIRREMGRWWKLEDVEVSKKYDPLSELWPTFQKWSTRSWNQRKFDQLQKPINEWVRWDGKPDTLASLKLSLGFPPFLKRWKACRLRESTSPQQGITWGLALTPNRGMAILPARTGPQPKRRGLEKFERCWSL